MDQRSTFASLAQANGGLYRAYLLKEQLRAIFQAAELADRLAEIVLAEARPVYAA